MSNKKCGYIAIIGRPNVGKSTLMNHIIKQKISITCRKPQTTRHQIMGVETTENTQFIFLDTPGLNNSHNKALNQIMNNTALSTVIDGDVILFVIDAMKFTPLDKWILEKIKNSTQKVILAINKSEKIKDKALLDEFVTKMSRLYKFSDIVCISAKHGHKLDILQSLIEKELPFSEFYYSAGHMTDKNEKFLVSEIVREKLFRSMGAELPYQTTVEVIHFKYDEIKKIIDISANILVERDSQKPMIIGLKGQNIKKLGTNARIDIEKLLGQRVYLQLWVKVKSNWSDDIRVLQSLGY